VLDDARVPRLGSPAAEKIQMYREHDLDYWKELAQDALGGRAADEDRLAQKV
jgi:hypothetical protein